MQKLNKRELIIIAISMAIVIVLGIVTIRLHQDIQTKDKIIDSTSATLRAQNSDSNEAQNYIATICAEYRKLYQSYREAAYPDPSKVDKYIGLPGSATGQIDECYLPE